MLRNQLWLLLGCVLIGLGSGHSGGQLRAVEGGTKEAEATAAKDQAAYYVFDLNSLKLLSGKLVERPHVFEWWNPYSAYVALEGEGEAYVDFSTYRDFKGLPLLAVKTATPRQIKGTLYLPKGNDQFEVCRFESPEGAPTDQKRSFLEVAFQHYRRLSEAAIPGTSWFSHRREQFYHQLNQTDAHSPVLDEFATARRNRQQFELNRTMELFTGSRAFAENLQLDRNLNGALQQSEPRTESIESEPGITIDPIDWDVLNKGSAPARDSLAKRIPQDQYVLFCPSVEQFLAVVERFSRAGLQMSRLAVPTGEDQGLMARYEHQLGVDSGALARLVGEQMVRSVAVTGSDPYWLEGTDLAIVLETTAPVPLMALLEARIRTEVDKLPDVTTEKGTIGQMKFIGFSTPDRTVSSYVAMVPEGVILTNSKVQLARMANLTPEQALDHLPEYHFFRGRYPLGDADESGLLFLSDPTIRRWCGPQMRILQSRRLRAAAELGDLTAEHADEIVTDKTQSQEIKASEELGQVKLTSHGIRSSVFNTLSFQTPLAELECGKVSQGELTAYRQWRDSYQSLWRWRFDPIALKIGVNARRMSADLTVMPLIFGTDYRELIELTHGGKLEPDAGDPHETLLHLVLALNLESRWVQMATNVAEQTIMRGRGAIGGTWLGKTAALYADPDPVWEALAKCEPNRRDKFLEERNFDLPIGLRLEVANPLKLTLFLASLRTWIEQTVPRMTDWGNVSYGDETYVSIRIHPPQGLVKEDHAPTLYYAVIGDSLLFSLNSKLIERAFDRQHERAAGKLPPREKEAQWLGESVAVETQGALGDFFMWDQRAWRITQLGMASQNNLPILNEFHERYPGQDPVAVYQRLWGTRLVCPAGGNYVWNEAYHTMESSTLGCPAAAKTFESIESLEKLFAKMRFGITFEPQGVRIKLQLHEPEQKP